ncbi:hypothetical protein [Vitiosangium sp. GDMCC 1.1324]|uniref:hypothetical protein n=1 Tax=Vitiosangium sp. (strain GDMCC 1.1324) TaxID=2138576 RepID=UPI0011B4F049|nr:hypothetical protein [Vitiosangium sp. GDMCC 1.1324]
MKLSESSELRFLEVARAVDQLLVKSFRDSFEALEPELKALQRKLLRSVVKTKYERKEVRRRIAETLFTEAYGRNCPWPVFEPTLRRIQRLGYSNIERRYHVACLYAQWCQRHPQHDSHEARRLLDETEQSVRRLPRDSNLRQGMLKDLSDLRAQTGFRPVAGPSSEALPQGDTSTSRMVSPSRSRSTTSMPRVTSPKAV